MWVAENFSGVDFNYLPVVEICNADKAIHNGFKVVIDVADVRDFIGAFRLRAIEVGRKFDFALKRSLPPKSGFSNVTEGVLEVGIAFRIETRLAVRLRTREGDRLQIGVKINEHAYGVF